MNKKTKMIIGLVSSIVIILSLFMPAIKLGFLSFSLWDGIEGESNGQAIVIFVFGVLGFIVSSMKKFEYLQVFSAGPLAIGLSLLINFIRTDLYKHIGIGLIFLILGSLVGVAIKEIPLEKKH